MADGKCTYKCTDLEDDQCDWKSTGEMMRRSSELDLCRRSAFMSTEAVPNETENGLRTYRIVYRTASRETVTERHCDRQSRQLPNDDYRIAFNGGRRNLGLGSHLPKAPTGMFTKRLTDMIAERPYWRPTSLLGRC